MPGPTSVTGPQEVKDDEMKRTVGILAYGSLIDDSREEIAGATIETRRQVVTPFKVEFARSSTKRAGAPTLVPVDEGGARVAAQIFVLDVSEKEATNRLYRREIDKVGSDRVYRARETQGANTVSVKRLENFEGVNVVLYTHITANIQPLTAGNLARLAIKSARALNNERDGISYLINAKRNGIRTLLSGPYEEEIKRRMDAADLKEALAKARAQGQANRS